MTVAAVDKLPDARNPDVPLKIRPGLNCCRHHKLAAGDYFCVRTANHAGACKLRPVEQIHLDDTPIDFDDGGAAA
ncbi:hypothetical protein [Sphingomonas sp. LaA6.9]|uniref:hypothetical protein n=1 Tax=Sphingomonas sp. LaA6.9 TaxID=2919914 RepID=UPI001F4F6DFB|nr:hypothetical protein [Sphingomonas sp. LaA6.9]MCJ8158826.1 hypothetical protein [Sphingomonas sp. LaA6.9]